MLVVLAAIRPLRLKRSRTTEFGLVTKRDKHIYIRNLDGHQQILSRALSDLHNS